MGSPSPTSGRVAEGRSGHWGPTSPRGPPLRGVAQNEGDSPTLKGIGLAPRLSVARTSSRKRAIIQGLEGDGAAEEGDGLASKYL